LIWPKEIGPKEIGIDRFLNSNLGFSDPQFTMHHAMNHVGFMISPELHVVQDREHGSLESYMVQGENCNGSAPCINIENLFKFGREDVLKKNLRHLLKRH